MSAASPPPPPHPTGGMEAPPQAGLPRQGLRRKIGEQVRAPVPGAPHHVDRVPGTDVPVLRLDLPHRLPAGGLPFDQIKGAIPVLVEAVQQGGRIALPFREAFPHVPTQVQDASGPAHGNELPQHIDRVHGHQQTLRVAMVALTPGMPVPRHHLCAVRVHHAFTTAVGDDEGLFALPALLHHPFIVAVPAFHQKGIPQARCPGQATE